MSTSNRLVSAFFTTLPGFFLFLFFLFNSWLSKEYWWGTYLTAFIVLLISSLLLGFSPLTVFPTLRQRHPWALILMQGLLAWILALIVLWLLNLTPLCIGQNNGDGNNDIGACMFMTVMTGIVYTPFYLSLLAVSSVLGHGVLSLMKRKAPV